MRIAVFAVALSLLALTVAATPATAAAEPVGGCGADNTVEVCVPVCIQGPCLPYVCVHRDADICVRA